MTILVSTYNGWTNYPTWALNLWMTNEEYSYNYWSENAEEAWNRAEPDDILTKSQCAKYALASQIEEYVNELAMDNNGESGPMIDILGWAINQINFDEIAESFLENNIETYE